MSRQQRPIDRIAPSGFVQEIDEQAPGREIDTVDEALAYASRCLSSSTDPAEQQRCPECESRRVILRAGRWGTDDSSKYKCDGCGTRFDRALPPLSRVKDDEPDDDEPDDDTMNTTHTAFEWIETDDLADASTRGESHVLRGLTEQARVELTLRLYKPWTDDGPSYREIAKLLPNSRYWVGARVREWHRELVPGPWPTVSKPGADRLKAD